MMRLGLLLLCLLAGGCVSVPLSTLARMSTFDEKDFVQLKPEVIRVRIKLPESFALDVQKSALAVSISSAAGTHDGEFKLEQVRMDRTPLSPGMFSGTLPGTAYTLKLAGASREAFSKLQDFVRRGRPGDVIITVAPRLSAFPDDAATVQVWIDLLLSEAEGFFTLVNAAEIPLDKIRAASAGS